MVGLGEQLVPVVHGEIDCLPLPGGAAVVVQRPAPNRAESAGALFGKGGEEAPGPVEIAAVGARGDEREFRAEVGHPGRVAAVFARVGIRCELAAAPPAFIADAPVAYRVRLSRSVGCAQLGQTGTAGRGVAVFDPLVEVLGTQAADIGGQVRAALRPGGRNARTPGCQRRSGRTSGDRRALWPVPGRSPRN